MILSFFRLDRARVHSLAVDRVVVALGLVVLVAVPSGVALLSVDSVSAVRVLLAVEQGAASGVALVILGLGVACFTQTHVQHNLQPNTRVLLTRAPPVTVDLEQTVVGAAVGIQVGGVAVERRLVLRDADHRSYNTATATVMLMYIQLLTDGRLREAGLSKVAGDLALALVVGLDRGGHDGSESDHEEGEELEEL